MTKWSVQKPTQRTTQKHVEHQDATDIQKTHYFLRFSDFKTLYPVCNMMVTYNANVCLYVETLFWQKGDTRLDVLINKTGRDISN